MSISSSTRQQSHAAPTASEERGATVAPVTLSERSITGPGPITHICRLSLVPATFLEIAADLCRTVHLCCARGA